MSDLQMSKLEIEANMKEVSSEIEIHKSDLERKYLQSRDNVNYIP